MATREERERRRVSVLHTRLNMASRGCLAWGDRGNRTSGPCGECMACIVRDVFDTDPIPTEGTCQSEIADGVGSSAPRYPASSLAGSLSTADGTRGRGDSSDAGRRPKAEHGSRGSISDAEASSASRDDTPPVDAGVREWAKKAIRIALSFDFDDDEHYSENEVHAVLERVGPPPSSETSERAAVIEECARVCDARAAWYGHQADAEPSIAMTGAMGGCERAAREIRALASPLPRVEAEPPKTLSGMDHNALRRMDKEALRNEIERLRCLLHQRPVTVQFGPCAPAEDPATPEQPIGVVGWQPIETAPKDGTKVVLCNTHTVGLGWWFHNAAAWSWESIWPATHWMPLPAPPGSAREHASTPDLVHVVAERVRDACAEVAGAYAKQCSEMGDVYVRLSDTKAAGSEQAADCLRTATREYAMRDGAWVAEERARGVNVNAIITAAREGGAK